MKKVIIMMLVLLPALVGCKHNESSQVQNLRNIAQGRVEEAILNSLIDKREAELGETVVEFETKNIVVLSCQVTARNRYGGMAKNVFEYICTADGQERVDNVSAGSTPYSAARALASDSVYEKGYKDMVEKELRSLMRYM